MSKTHIHTLTNSLNNKILLIKFCQSLTVHVCLSAQVYLLVLSVTTLSLLLAPVLWRVTTHKFVPRAERKTITWPDWRQGQKVPDINFYKVRDRSSGLFGHSEALMSTHTMTWNSLLDQVFLLFLSINQTQSAASSSSSTVWFLENGLCQIVIKVLCKILFSILDCPSSHYIYCRCCYCTRSYMIPHPKVIVRFILSNSSRAPPLHSFSRYKKYLTGSASAWQFSGKAQVPDVLPVLMLLMKLLMQYEENQIISIFVVCIIDFVLLLKVN